MIYFIILLAACSGAAFHFSFRKCLEHEGRTSVFLMLQCLFAFIFVTFMTVRIDNFTKCDLTTCALGTLEGGIYVVMMWLLGRAFQTGPAGLTVATMNSASVLPALIMAFLFGAPFGHAYSYNNGIGAALVVLGLFLASRKNAKEGASAIKQWLFFALLALFGHTLYLTLMQWRALLLKAHDIAIPYTPFTFNVETAHWFQSMIFLSAFLIQAVVYMVKDRAPFSKKEVFWSLVGGAANALCTFSLVFASEIAEGVEKVIIFSASGVISIILCNIWGRMIYKEQVQWKALGISLSGIIVGSV